MKRTVLMLLAVFTAALAFIPPAAYAQSDEALPDFLRGTAELENGNNDKAIEYFTEAIRKNPNHDQAYNNRGIAYARKREYDKAIADYTQAIRINPNMDMAYKNRGAAYYYKGNHRRAIADFEEALRINPNNAGARQDLETVRRQRGR